MNRLGLKLAYLFVALVLLCLAIPVVAGLASVHQVSSNSQMVVPSRSYNYTTALSDGALVPSMEFSSETLANSFHTSGEYLKPWTHYQMLQEYQANPLDPRQTLGLPNNRLSNGDFLVSPATSSKFHSNLGNTSNDLVGLWIDFPTSHKTYQVTVNGGGHP